MNRRESRINAFSLLFESDFHPDSTYSEILSRAELIGDNKYNDFTRELYNTATSHIKEIDAEIEAASNNWKLLRMSVVARALTRLAVSEIMYSQVPPKAAINEAVEISKIYDDEKATAFINGVLNNIARHLGKIIDNEN